MNTIPDMIFNISIGTTVVTQEPARTAIPSTIMKPITTPINKCKCFFVFDDKRSIDICVLSPSSARAIAINGMIKSSIILIPTLSIMI
jgi:hypothetical protein